MIRKAFLASWFVCSLMFVPSAYAGRSDIVSYYPATYGAIAILKSTADCYFATASGNVGIGLAWGSATVKLDIAQNTAMKVGQAYLSSGGNYAHLATNEWYNGSAWTTNGSAGVLFQLDGATAARVYYHDTSGNHTTWATVSSTSGWAAGTCSQAYKQNIHKLTLADYVSLREGFLRTNLFSYNRKDTPTEPEVGFISEYAPELILSGQDKTQVTLLKAMGYVTAIAKAHEYVLGPLGENVRDLKRDRKIFQAQQQQASREIQDLKAAIGQLESKFGNN